jgi:hypothetical protein
MKIEYQKKLRTKPICLLGGGGKVHEIDFKLISSLKGSDETWNTNTRVKFEFNKRNSI